MRTRIATALTIGILIWSGPGAAAIAPSSGTYAAGIYVISAAGSGCFDSAGAYYTGVVQYGGIAARTIYLNVPYPQNYDVSAQTLSVTSGVGTVHPSGKFTWAFQGRLQSSVNGTFNSTLVEINANKFVAEVDESYPNCQEGVSISLIKTGPHL